MKVQIVAEAEAELTAAIEYYEQVERGLGVRLKAEVQSVVT